MRQAIQRSYSHDGIPMLDRTPHSSHPRDSSHADEPATSPFDYQAKPAKEVCTLAFSFDAAPSTPHEQRDETAATFPVIPGYQISRELGRGGMGGVYQAFEPKLNRYVALKVLREHFHKGDTVEKRFAGEADVLSRLDHPNVVRVYAVGEFAGRPYYAMKYVPGGSLDNHAARFRVTAAHAVRLMAKLARAVQYLHDRGVWHRDLKPLNILLDEHWEPLIADFGVAKWLEGEQYSVGSVCVGTFAYMAPEMILRGSAFSNAQADVWSLGVMLFELLAGVRPFPGDNRDPQLPHRVMADPPLPLAQPEAVPGIDERLEAIVLKALAKEPCHRYLSAEALAADLEAWLGNETVTDVPSLLMARRNATAAATTAVPETGVRAPRSRSRWLAIPTGVAIVAAVFALAWSGGPRPEPDPLPAPEPQPPPTFQDAWARDGDVTVIDGEGKPRFPLTPIPGSIPGVIGTDSEGPGMTISGMPLGLYEIGSLRPPFRFTAEVYHVSGTERPFVGLYVLRKGTPARQGVHQEHDFISLAVDLFHTGNNVTGKADQGGIWVDFNLLRIPSFLSTSSGELELPRHILRRGKTPRDYRELVVDVHPDHATCKVDGKPFPPLPWKTVEMGILAKRFTEKRPDPKPRLGDGFGLFTANGTAAFRDVRVCPIP